MTISQMPFFTEISAGHSGPVIPESKRVYFQTRLRNRLFDFILGKFLDEQKKGLTKAILARRIGKTPDVINRWLGAPSNLTVDTMSDLLLGISAEELELSSFDPNELLTPNYMHSDWIAQPYQESTAVNSVFEGIIPKTKTEATTVKRGQTILESVS